MGEPNWLRNTDGHVRLHVLKPFLFLHKEVTTLPDGTERIEGNPRRFMPGEHLLDPENPQDAQVLAHTWIHRDFADGAVEAPDATRARLQAQEERDAAEAARRKALLEEARVALEREQIAAENANQAGEDVTGELNTPLNAPRVRNGGKRGKAPVDPEALARELNTPLNKLGK